ncbi:MAG: hypothetical protein A2W93_07670 [Bacteroidetes bacterium GWF2_43_63]|nr:MAG: hypothetical protein A2W93_07670 [Bacteroidetes bacterium GWF2_43_63]HBG69190.1 hypothetical protein [Bacteroidales bacterium]
MKWKALKQLNQLYKEGETSNELLGVPLGKRILEMEYVIIENKKTISKTNYYDSFYSENLQEKFRNYSELIERYNLNDTNFEESELNALLKIEQTREQILDSSKSQKEISTLYFDSAKYLTKSSKLYNAVLSVLEINELPIDEHDQQYLKILHCKSRIPKTIILCENDNQIKKERLYDVELWYVGGRNTAKLHYVIEPEIPFYYLCDWDNRGIEIYQSIKRIYFPKIEILVPQQPIKTLDKIREWKTEIDYSLFPKYAKELLAKLIPEKWIEEESINHELLRR